MRKTIIPILFLLIISSGFSIFGLFEKPITPVDITTLHSINQSNYGFNETNSTCAPIHFSLPYQFPERTYIRLGYIPLCDINQSSYEESITFFCNGEYLFTDNVTDACLNGNNFLDNFNSEWIEINSSNSQQGVFQSEGLRSVFSCLACINSTSNIPQADFWIRAENTGNRVIIESYNETVIVGIPEITSAMLEAVNITLLILQIISTSLTVFAVIWAIFALPLFLIFVLKNVYSNIRKLLYSARGRK